eukprot:2269212-Amphidinium_carterae.3
MLGKVRYMIHAAASHGVCCHHLSIYIIASGPITGWNRTRSAALLSSSCSFKLKAIVRGLS